eukprot:4638921-Heterocapsa_arctica.AAC.1
MAEMCVANDGEIGITQWYRDAVELGRFYQGGESDDMTVCSLRTAARILEFIKPSLQLPGQIWMANRIERPLGRAVEAYAAHIKNYGLENM